MSHNLDEGYMTQAGKSLTIFSSFQQLEVNPNLAFNFQGREGQNSQTDSKRDLIWDADSLLLCASMVTIIQVM